MIKMESRQKYYKTKAVDLIHLENVLKVHQTATAFELKGILKQDVFQYQDKLNSMCISFSYTEVRDYL